ncbi:MAG: YraN family protein, partial [Opitutaceae bacterium]
MPLRIAGRNENYVARPPPAATMFSWLKAFLTLGGAPVSAGAAGERTAAEFLRRECGFSVVARNWRSPRDRRDELDLVCRDGEVLVFVEVKTRADTARVPGYSAIDARKKRALRRACSAYLRALGRARPLTFRFDVVELSTHS